LAVIVWLNGALMNCGVLAALHAKVDTDPVAPQRNC